MIKAIGLALLLALGATGASAQVWYPPGGGPAAPAVVTLTGCPTNGGTCTGTGSGGGPVTQGTTPWVDAIEQWGSTPTNLGLPTAWGVAPSGNVIGTNSYVLNTVTVTPVIVGPGSAPAVAETVVLPDEVSACTGSNTCTASGATTLAVVDMTGYASATVTVTANASGNTVSFSGSDDNVNFVATFGQNVSAQTGLAASSTPSASLITYRLPKQQRYLKIAVTNYISGSTTVTVQLHQNSPQGSIVSNPVLNANSNAIGKVGPGFTSAQTPITASATGTTAATTATLAGTSGKTTWLCGFSIRANATAAATGTATVTGTITGTMNFTQWTAALATGVGVTEPPIGHICIPASGTNVGIAVVSAAPGSGGTVSVSAWGYQE